MHNMRLVVATAVVALAAMAPAASANSGSFSGTVQNFDMQNPENGEGCRLKGVDKDSANFKNYASLPATDVDVTAACGRCVRVTCDDDKCTAGSSVTAYVLDVCQSCKSGEMKASKSALGELGVDTNANGVKVSYKMVNCPSSLLSGNIKACLMEGASNTYIPMQFYNSQKVIKSVKINGVDGAQQKGSFQYNANTNQNEQPKSDWYGNVEVELTAADGDSQKAKFAFGGPSGCATSDVQFAAASTADAQDGGNGKSGGGKSASGSGKSGTIIGVVCGVVGALVIVIGSVFYVRRRRAANSDAADDMEGGQYLSPRLDKRPPPGEVTTHTFDAGYPSTPAFEEPSQEPVTEYNHATSPGAALKPAVAATTTAATAAAYSTPPRESSPAPAPGTSLPLPASNYINHESMSSDESYSFSSEVPKYSYSSDMKYSFSSNVSNTSPERPSRPAAPMVPAPVVPSMREAAQPRVIRTAESEERTSFDIDDMRSTEDFNGNSYATNDYSAAYNSSYASTAVTSPQSYVRATSLRRNSSRDQAPRNNGSVISDSSFVGGNAQFPRSSARDSSYSRDSLNILEYPYAKKTGRNAPNSDVEF